jgi:hypothetical protein
MEECAEIQYECSKALRFGLEDVYDGNVSDETNRESITRELDDLLGTVEMLRQENILDPEDPKRQNHKQVKVERFLKYSKEKGLLT